MKRYDKKDSMGQTPKVKEDFKREHVQISKEMMQKIAKIYIDRLKALEVNNVNVVSNVHRDQIIFNADVSLTQLSTKLGKKLVSKNEFAKEFYMYSLDSMIDEAYGKKVTAIQEFPYSFQETHNDNVITFEFIV